MTSFDANRFAALASERGLSLGAPLSVVEVTGSTNDDALAAARAGAPHGATFVAEAQANGRGRRGRAWASPPGVNLTFSVIVRPSVPLGRVSAVPLVVGLAVRAAVARRLTTPVELKWPNDVLVDGRKLAGVLVESQLSGHRLAALVVGVGLNVALQEFPADLAGIATSLALSGARDLGRETLLLDVLAALEERLALFEEHGLAPLHRELTLHDALAGARVRVDGVAGLARGIDADGALLVADAGGALRRVIAGSVERL
ncbi:MAG: biotin--[acetyl-CoA-carboxylase] ligase [Sorangiineae bacterium]|nr:biotin--[acetyl-CoA-carboxylase] ligase [Polyangiaceae bacterium]MEB2321147.1 biotin--[acetyl-CoA-carboxylase] ligase [Sorangiineae bacterium]